MKKSQREARVALRERQQQKVAEYELVASLTPYFDMGLRGDKGFRNRQLGKPDTSYVHKTPGRLSEEDVRELRRRAGWGHEYKDIAHFFGADREYVKEVANYRARKTVH